MYAIRSYYAAGIKKLHFVGVDGCLITTLKGMAGQHDRQSPSGFEHGDFIYDLLKRHNVPIVLIDGMQAGRAAGRVIRLRQNFVGESYNFV